MSISLVAETNFNAMIPFVLAELASLDRTSIATVMSIQAAADITGRLCVPLLAQKAGWTCRNLYIISLLGSIFGRTRTYYIKYIIARYFFINLSERICDSKLEIIGLTAFNNNLLYVINLYKISLFFIPKALCKIIV